MSNKQTILNTIYSTKRLFSELKLGIFSSERRRKETFWHWEYNRITAKKPIVEIYETDYNHVQIVTNILFK